MRLPVTDETHQAKLGRKNEEKTNRRLLFLSKRIRDLSHFLRVFVQDCAKMEPRKTKLDEL
jgi:hypothetical protein